MQKLQLWVGVAFLMLSVLFLVIGVTTAQGADNETDPMPSGTGIFAVVVQMVCGPPDGLRGVLKEKNMYPVFTGEAVRGYSQKSAHLKGSDHRTVILFMNKGGEYAFTEWGTNGFACLNLVGAKGDIMLPEFKQL